MYLFDKSKMINYKFFADRIIELIYSIETKVTFEEECNKIGKEIYTIGGYKGLRDVIRIIEDELLNCEYSNEYLSYIRDIENIFSEIKYNVVLFS